MDSQSITFVNEYTSVLTFFFLATSLYPAPFRQGIIFSYQAWYENSYPLARVGTEMYIRSWGRTFH